MKYLTKEWYGAAQKSDFHLLLKASKQAASFSAEYFKALYKKEEANWLKFQEEVADVRLEDIFTEEASNLSRFDGKQMTSEELERSRKIYAELREQILRYSMNRSAFDSELEKRNFRKRFNKQVKHLQSNLPDGILKKVADIRVLALNCATAEVIEEITAFCKANENAVEAASKRYDEEYQNSFKEQEPPFVKDFCFHDCTVASCHKKGKSLVIELDNAGGFTNISQITFKNCTVLKQDKPLHGAWWLYEEIYKTEDGYEIHVLLDKKYPQLIDFIVHATDVLYERENLS